ncbi:hypothetical protein AMTR_s00060p00129410 [Amborella trichopoda]|uniref:Uncharacterized protein n=1 Tax=Amborella trichopoda TaxID=13333 RepID=W1NK76_AMBTC|nr:hypothetical protein AMTR_s00060p00129410 [Amborella trichopoda]
MWLEDPGILTNKIGVGVFRIGWAKMGSKRWLGVATVSGGEEGGSGQREIGFGHEGLGRGFDKFNTIIVKRGKDGVLSKQEEGKVSKVHNLGPIRFENAWAHHERNQKATGEESLLKSGV